MIQAHFFPIGNNTFTTCKEPWYYDGAYGNKIDCVVRFRCSKEHIKHGEYEYNPMDKYTEPEPDKSHPIYECEKYWKE